MKPLAAIALIPLLQAGAVVAQTIEPDQLPNIVVIERQPSDPAMSPLKLPDNSFGLGIDGAEIIRSLTGVSAGRFGGHGLEPVIRGQSQGRLNVLLDGAYVHGGCANRMDPPTSFMGAQSYDKVVVLRGVQTLVHGSGGSGGTVLFERSLEAPDDGLDGSAGISASSNGVDSELFADIAVGGKEWVARGIASRHDASNYKDGDGREVRSAYMTTSGTLAVGYLPSKDTRLELTLESVRTEGALFSGAGLDAGKTPGYGVLDLHGSVPVGQIGEFRLGVQNVFDKTYVDHLNRANQDPFNPEPVQVNEPGRSLWASWRSMF